MLYNFWNPEIIFYYLPNFVDECVVATAGLGECHRNDAYVADSKLPPISSFLQKNSKYLYRYKYNASC